MFVCSLVDDPLDFLALRFLWSLTYIPRFSFELFIAMIDILAVLDAAYHGSKEVRSAALEELSAAMASLEAPCYLRQLVLVGTDPSVPKDRSLSALIQAKNSLMYMVPETVLMSSPDVMMEVQTALLNGALQELSDAHRRVICECVATLISGFDWNYLPEIIPRVQQHFQGSALPSLVYTRGLLQLLYVYLKRMKTPLLVPSSTTLEVVTALLNMLPVYIQRYNNYDITHITLKLMECVLEGAMNLSASEAKQVKGNEFDSWFTCISAFFASHITNPQSLPVSPEGRLDRAFTRCVKRIGIISFALLNEATRRKKPSRVAAYFMTALSPAAPGCTIAIHFLQLFETWLGYAVSSPPLPSWHSFTSMKSELYAIRYLKLCTLNELLYTQHILPNAVQLIEKLLLPYLAYNEEDEEVFLLGPGMEHLSEYTQYMLGESVGMGEMCPRQAASNTILAFIGGKKKFHAGGALLQPLLAALGNELGMEDSMANMPRLFGILHLLSILRKNIRSNAEIWQTQMHAVLSQYVAPRTSAHMPLFAVRVKALTVCQRYSKVPMPSEEVFVSFVHMICQTLHDSDSRIRVSGIDAICTLLEMKRARPYLTPCLIPLVEQCIELVEKVNTVFIPTVILHVVTHFAPEVSSMMDRLGKTLVQQFLASAFEMNAMEDNMDDKVMQEYETAALSADSLLRAISTVLTSCEHNLPVVAALRPSLVHLIQTVIPNPNSYEYMEQTLVIFLHLVHFTNPITPDLWSLLPLLFETVSSGTGVDYFQNIEEVLDNFISGATVEYCHNGELMEVTLGACRKMLTESVVAAEECMIAAPQLLEALLHQAKAPQCPPGILQPYLPAIVGMLLQGLLIRSAEPGSSVHLRIWMAAAIMDCFYYDAEGTLQILLEQQAAEGFLNGFFTLFSAALSTELQQQLCGVAQPAGSKQAKKKKKKGQTREEEEVLETLSILTRKVCVLGLSSLLALMFQPPAALASRSPALAAFQSVFFSHYADPAVSFVLYCVGENHRLYTARCAIATESLQRIEAGDVEDDVVDVDIDDDAVLGIDGGDDLEEGMEDLSDEDEDGEYESGVTDGFGFEPDEGDDYDSPIDAINEVRFCIDAWMNSGEALSSLRVPLPSNEAVMALEQTAGQYYELCNALEKAMEVQYEMRKQ